jgi:type IV secretion system protein VirB1
MLDILALAAVCAPSIHPRTMQVLVNAESSGNAFAIGVVGGHLARQPSTLAEAVATARDLERKGFDFSVGLAQINRQNLPAYKLDIAQAFDVCKNLAAGADILQKCYARAANDGTPSQDALRQALSCYYSGNFSRGFKPDGDGTSYVQRVNAATTKRVADGSRVPAMEPLGGSAGAELPPIPIPLAKSVSPGKTPTKRAQEGLPDAFGQSSRDAFSPNNEPPQNRNLEEKTNQ